MRRFFARLTKLFTRGRSHPSADEAQKEAPAKLPETTPEPQSATTPVAPMNAPLEAPDVVVPEVVQDFPDVVPDLPAKGLPEAAAGEQYAPLVDPVEPVEHVGVPKPSPPLTAPPARPAGPEVRREPEAAVPLTEPVPVPVPLPERDQTVRYADYSDSTYDAVDGGFPDPPGLAAEADAAPTMTPAMSTLTPTLPLALLDETLAELSAGRARVEDVIGAEPVSVGWPRSAADGPRLEIPSPDERFRDSTGDVRTLQSALADGGLTDALDRLELVRLIGIGLQALHAAEMVTGGVSLAAYAFTLEPRPTLCLLRPDLLRRIGGEQLVVDAGTWGRRFDEDRYEFAVLTHQLLVSGRPEATIQIMDEVRVAGLRRGQCQRLERLWSRASREPGTRPQMTEWMEVLLP